MKAYIVSFVTLLVAVAFLLGVMNDRHPNAVVSAAPVEQTSYKDCKSAAQGWCTAEYPDATPEGIKSCVGKMTYQCYAPQVSPFPQATAAPTNGGIYFFSYVPWNTGLPHEVIYFCSDHDSKEPCKKVLQ